MTTIEDGSFRDKSLYGHVKLGDGEFVRWDLVEIRPEGELKC